MITIIINTKPLFLSIIFSNNGPFITILPTFEFESDQSIVIKLIRIQNCTNKHNSGMVTVKTEQKMSTEILLYISCLMIQSCAVQKVYI